MGEQRATLALMSLSVPVLVGVVAAAALATASSPGAPPPISSTAAPHLAASRPVTSVSAAAIAEPSPGVAAPEHDSSLPHITVLPLPAPVTVLTPFRAPDGPYGSGHRGVDLAAEPGAAVVAPLDGTVVFAGSLAGRGVVSIAIDDGLRATFEPLRPAVAAGDVVRAGDVLGTVEAGHPSCAPDTCLHWGMRLGDDRYVDPMLLVLRRTVVLLPWREHE